MEPRPIEETDPEFAELLQWYCNTSFPKKKKVDDAPNPVEIGDRVGRNDKCPCGSGKKYKKCCMNKG
jgi:uncharacterized protein YecA (UPF0149 family)